MRDLHWFSLDFKKAGGQKQWSVVAISEMCKTYQQMARRLMNVGSIHQLMGRTFLLQHKSISTLHLQKTKVECISSVQKSSLEYSWDTS